MAFNTTIQVSDQDLRTSVSPTQASGAAFTPDIRFGQTGQTWDGRVYEFAQAGAVALAVGLTVQSPASVANHQNRTQTTAQAQAIGSTTIAITVGATLVSANQYLSGYLNVVSGTGAGYTYRVKSNTAAASAGTTTVTLYDPILIATDSTSVVSLFPHANASVIVTPTSSPLNVVGVPDIAVPATNYFWAQTAGWCGVQSDSTAATANAGIIPSTTTAGNVALELAATVTQRLGYTVAALTSAQYKPVMLTIAYA